MGRGHFERIGKTRLTAALGADGDLLALAAGEPLGAAALATDAGLVGAGFLGADGCGEATELAFLPLPWLFARSPARSCTGHLHSFPSSANWRQRHTAVTAAS